MLMVVRTAISERYSLMVASKLSCHPARELAHRLLDGEIHGDIYLTMMSFIPMKCMDNLEVIDDHYVI